MPTKAGTARYTLFGLEVVENIGLIIIGLATVVAGYHSGSVLLIALAVLVIRHGHVRFPYGEDAVRPGAGWRNGILFLFYRFRRNHGRQQNVQTQGCAHRCNTHG